MIRRTEEQEDQIIRALIPAIRKIYRIADEYIPEVFQEERSAKMDRAVEEILALLDVRAQKFGVEYEAARRAAGHRW